MTLPRLFLMTALVMGSAHGAITYVDAEDGALGNTFPTGGTQGDTLTGWDERTVFGNGGVVWQGIDNDPELNTQITGLADGTYDVWVFFWDATNGNDQWTIQAGFTSGALTLYSNDGAGDTSQTVDAFTLSFDAAVLVDEGNRDLYGVNLGQVAVSGGSTINVFIDSRGSGGSDSRTWYDGVGYELIPEPSSLCMAALGGLLLLRRKRGQ